MKNNDNIYHIIDMVRSNYKKKKERNENFSFIAHQSVSEKRRKTKEQITTIWYIFAKTQWIRMIVYVVVLLASSSRSACSAVISTGSNRPDS